MYGMQTIKTKQRPAVLREPYVAHTMLFEQRFPQNQTPFGSHQQLEQLGETSRYHLQRFGASGYADT